MYAWYFYFLCHHGEYSCGFLHSVEIIHMGLKIYNAMMQILFYFLNVMLMQKSKYAKVKNNSCNAKSKIWITTDVTSWPGFRFLSPPDRTWLKKSLYSSGASSGLNDGDSDGWTSCDSVSDGDVTFSFHTYLVCGLNIGGVGASFTTSLGSSSPSQLFFRDWFFWF